LRQLRRGDGRAEVQADLPKCGKRAFLVWWDTGLRAATRQMSVAVSLLIAVPLLVMSCGRLGVSSVLGARNEGTAAILVQTDGLTRRIDPGQTAIADSFSGPFGKVDVIDVLDTHCTTLGSVTWGKSNNAVISMSVDDGPSLTTMEDPAAWDHVPEAPIVDNCPRRLSS
jgi:hypothetical protein